VFAGLTVNHIEIGDEVLAVEKDISFFIEFVKSLQKADSPVESSAVFLFLLHRVVFAPFLGSLGLFIHFL
jgi:hypothetical protein